MTGITAFIYHKNYLKYQFGPAHPFQPMREKKTFDLLKKLEVFNKKAKYFKPKSASEKQLLLVHSKEYVEFVKRMSKVGKGFLDYGDTPATKGIYEGTCSRVGGSLLATDLIMKGKALHAFNPGGGLHHAKVDRASGFCVFNDIAITVRYLQKKYGLKRIAIIDIDGHHGDGTQEIFYFEPILKISFHRIGIFPNTGFTNEIGEGKGKGYSVNIPLPTGTYGEAYLYAFNEIISRLIEKYKPEILINQFGVDAHWEDPLVGLALTTKSYEELAKLMHKLAHEFCKGRYLILGGGGYNIPNVIKCWAIMFLTVSGVKIERKSYEELFDKFEPEKDERIFEEVKKIVKEIKKIIFPLSLSSNT